MRPSSARATLSGAQVPDDVPSVFTTCTNCEQQILTTNFQLHELHCCRNFRRCAHCNQLLPIAEIEAHMEERRGSLDELAAALDRGDAARVTSALEHDASGELLDAVVNGLHLALQR